MVLVATSHAQGINQAKEVLGEVLLCNSLIIQNDDVVDLLDLFGGVHLHLICMDPGFYFLYILISSLPAL